MEITTDNIFDSMVKGNLTAPTILFDLKGVWIDELKKRYTDNDIEAINNILFKNKFMLAFIKKGE